jgi:lipopolysaccharide transport system ATP-binding protein
MSDVVIRVENLSKRYKIGKRERYKALRDTLTDAIGAPLRMARAALRRDNGGAKEASDDQFWALKNVSFEVKRGEVVGIIGRNGAGKSTLLKILSRITRPTEGRISMRGRVGALLEVGTGFHPELTGRENIYLNGAILGMRRADIIRKFDEIVAFAEVEQFIDTPVKHYSSGMYLRLAFSVAAHLEPEILVVDEVLAVGDAQFQKKCLGKIGEVAKEGRTVLFVSHNMTAVQTLCGDAIWLHGGQIVHSGKAGTVASGYLQSASSSCTSHIWPDVQSAPGNKYVRLKSARIVPPINIIVEEITVNIPFSIEIVYLNLKPDVYLSLSLTLYNQEGVCVLASTTTREQNWHNKPFSVGFFRSTCDIPADLLNSGIYRVLLLIVKNTSTILYQHEDIITFEIQDLAIDRGDWHGKWPGAVRPNLHWNTDYCGTLNS